MTFDVKPSINPSGIISSRYASAEATPKPHSLLGHEAHEEIHSAFAHPVSLLLQDAPENGIGRLNICPNI